MTRFPICAALVVLVAAPSARADEPVVLEFRTERIDAPDWRITGLEAAIDLSDGGLRGGVRIGRLEVPAAGLDLADTVVSCGLLALDGGHLRCLDGTLTAEFPVIGRQTAAAAFDYARDSGVTTFEIERLPLAGTALKLAGSSGAAGSEVRFSGDALQIEGLVAIANALHPGLGAPAASGNVSVSGELRSTAAGSLQMRLDARLSGASIANDAGTLVADAVDGTLQLEAARADADWRFDLALFADRGEVYVEPVYANLAEQALRVHAGNVRTRDFVTVDVGRFELEQDSLVNVAGSARLSVPPGAAPATVDSATIEIADTSVQAVYTGFLQILAAGTILGDLETAGRVSGSVAVRDNELQAGSFELDGLILDDRQRRFAVYGLGGTVNWPGPTGSPGAATPSRLSWESANAGDILLGGAELVLRLGGNDLELVEPLRIPTMGGALLINRLVLNDYGSDAATGLLDAELEPIQLGQLSGAFGWPAFSGSLSGRLPLLQYEGNAMTVGGSLTANAFDGNVEVSNLRIVGPFGRVPRLTGDIRLRQLDLERVTNTFSFGLIQGRLSGDVTGLQMVGWRPVEMDLHLYTPPDDRSPHRISQRAVENLASVGGGGAAAALSTGLLTFFEVFAYDRIALRCVLRDGTCAMSGAGAAAESPFGRGYYIVKGKGLPRIDVVGYRSQVSWQSLVRQLSNITRSTPRVVN